MRQVGLHTAECAERFERDAAEALAFVQSYGATYCRECSGAGLQYSGSLYDPSGADPCDACLAECRCPRCAATVPGDEDEIDPETVQCEQCGWTLDTGGSPLDEAMPCFGECRGEAYDREVEAAEQAFVVTPELKARAEAVVRDALAKLGIRAE